MTRVKRVRMVVGNENPVLVSGEFAAAKCVQVNRRQGIQPCFCSVHLRMNWSGRRRRSARDDQREGGKCLSCNSIAHRNAPCTWSGTFSVSERTCIPTNVALCLAQRTGSACFDEIPSQTRGQEHDLPVEPKGVLRTRIHRCGSTKPFSESMTWALSSTSVGTHPRQRRCSCHPSTAPRLIIRTSFVRPAERRASIRVPRQRCEAWWFITLRPG